VVVVLALTPDMADPTIFDSIPRSAGLVAAGPGWASVELEDPILRVDGLGATVETLTRLHSAHSGGPMA
jgi:hypothetical protein